MKNNFKTSKKIKEIINNKNIPPLEKNYLIWLEGYDCGQAEEILNKHNIYSKKKQSDKIAVMQEFHDNETS